MTITRRIEATAHCDKDNCHNTVYLVYENQFDFAGHRGAGDKSAGPTIRSIRALARERGWTMGGPHSLDVCPEHTHRR